jgi:hypothetical protein
VNVRYYQFKVSVGSSEYAVSYDRMISEIVRRCKEAVLAYC